MKSYFSRPSCAVITGLICYAFLLSMDLGLAAPGQTTRVIPPPMESSSGSFRVKSQPSAEVDQEVGELEPIQKKSKRTKEVSVDEFSDAEPEVSSPTGRNQIQQKTGRNWRGRPTTPSALPQNALKSPQVGDAWLEKKSYLFGGVDLGYSSYGAYNPTAEGNRTGFHGGIRGLYAYYLNDWVFDGGLGWQMINNSGKNPDGSKNSVSTKMFYLDLSPRYRIDRNWQIGPEIEFWLGRDNGLNQDALSTLGNNGMFWGLQGMYEWMNLEDKYRVGARWLTDINAKDRSVHILQFFVQFGFPWSTEKTGRETEGLNEKDLNSGAGLVDVGNEPEAWTDQSGLGDISLEGPEAGFGAMVPGATEINAKPPKAAVVLTLDTTEVPFGYRSAELPKNKVKRIQNIGSFLGKNDEKWKELVVKGHTDERGSAASNKILSKKRAEAVRKILIEGGAKPEKVKSLGLGESQPLDRRHNEKAWAKNRRVELEFKGVKDVQIMKRALEDD